MSFKLKNELDGMEAKILGFEEDLEKAQRESTTPEVISSAGRVQELYEKIGKLQTKIEGLYARWAELEKMAKGE